MGARKPSLEIDFRSAADCFSVRYCGFRRSATRSDSGIVMYETVGDELKPQSYHVGGHFGIAD